MIRLIERILNRIRYEKSKLFSPQMISGYRGTDGVRLKNTRISNTTYIGCKDKLFIADNVFIGHFNYIDSCRKITIKEGCQITNYISILTHSSHVSIRLYGKEYTNHKNLKGYIEGSVYIGEYAFIGPHSTIMPNSIIGKGCLVAAYSYVQGKFPDFSIIGGNPAKIEGDTREMDEKFLTQYPELRTNYDAWSKSIVSS